MLEAKIHWKTGKRRTASLIFCHSVGNVPSSLASVYPEGLDNGRNALRARVGRGDVKRRKIYYIVDSKLLSPESNKFKFYTFIVL